MKFFFTTILVSFISLALAANEWLSFQHFSQQDGLADNYVEQIVEDENGFIWFATHSGLCRFDGRNFKTFLLPDSLSNRNVRNYISAVEVYDSNHLLVGTLTGLYVLNKQSAIYRPVKDTADYFDNLYKRIDQIISVDSNSFALATGAGFFMIDKHSQTVMQYGKDKLKPKQLRTVSHLYDSVFYIGSETGFESIDASSETVERLENNSWGTVSYIYTDEDNGTWISTVQNGLFYKNKYDSVFIKYPLIDFSTNTEIHPSISSVNQDSHGRIWIGSWDMGLIVLDTDTRTVQVYNENNEAPHNLHCNSIDNIFRDSYGNMWLSMHGCGAAMYSPDLSVMKQIKKSMSGNGLVGSFVSSFYAESDSVVWIGTDGNGMSRWSRKSNTFTNYSKKEGLQSEAVLDMVKVSEKELFFATWEGGLGALDEITGKIQHFYFPPDCSIDCQSNIKDIYYDKINDLIWCGTVGNGVQIFDYNKSRFWDSVELNRNFPFWDRSQVINKVHIDKTGSVWLLENDFVFYIENNKLYNLNYVDSACHTVYAPTDLLETLDGSIYISNADGLFLFDRQSKCLHKIESKELHHIKSLVEDSSGNIWISTNSSIYVYSPNQNKIQNYSLLWGSVSMDFYQRAALYTQDSLILLGGMDGFVSIDRKIVERRIFEPLVIITKVDIIDRLGKSGKSRHINDAINREFIELEYYESFINIAFAALNYIDIDKSRFEYKLDGFDREWIKADKNNKATYTNIPPGNYVFRVKTSNSQGELSSNETVMKIIVHPAWWATMWFRFLLVVVITGLIVTIFRYRVRMLHKQNKRLSLLVDERTKKLADTNDLLKQSNTELVDQKEEILNQYDNLREKQLVIEMKNSQLEEAIETKDHLIKVIGHDFKTPLTSISGFAQILNNQVEELSGDKIKVYTSKIINGVNNLTKQMLGVIDWANSQNDEVVYKPVELNPRIIVSDIISLVYETASKKEISIETDYSAKTGMYADPRMVSTVLRNVLINAVKFTPRGSSILVSLTEVTDSVVISISDTGIGMSEEQIESAFKIKAEGEIQFGTEREKGTGLGLIICKKFIDKNKGSIQIESEKEKGTKVIISLPKGSTEFKENVYKLEKVDKQVSLSPPSNSYSILIVDDNKEVVDMMYELFESNFRIFEAYDGDEAFAIAQRELPDIILSDVDMPKKNGIELCQAVKSSDLTSHIPILLVSAKSRTEDLLEGYNHKADGYITKPFVPEILLESVESLIYNRTQLIKYAQSLQVNKDTSEEKPEIGDVVVNKAVAIIEEQFSDSGFSVSKLTDQLFISRTQLYRKFKAILGQSPVDYIRTVRLKKSAELLKRKGVRVSEVAYMVGYSDPKYFTNCFKKEFGTSPRNFQKGE